jgi:hypothetical protein
MAMQSLMRGFASEAIDMTQGAYERATGQTAAGPRVHEADRDPRARTRARAASRALAASEDLLDRADEQTGDEPHRINFYRHSRLPPTPPRSTVT